MKRSLKFRSLVLRSNIFCAPLAGCSDLPFRRMTAEYKPGLMFCEMVKMEALIRKNEQTYQMLRFEPGMHPIGGQICGSNVSIAGACAKIIEDLGFDVVDLNCGCPVDKVTKDGSGSGMLKTPEKIGEIICEMVAAVKIPVTVKIRLGWDEQSINAPLITQIAESAGAAAICIHGRTRAQGYHGPAKWDYIRQCKEAAKNIYVIGNGDVVCGESAEKIMKTTGCDAVLVARGTMGQPWVIEDIERHLEGKEKIPRSFEDFKKAFLKHLEHIAATQPLPKAITDLRRVGGWYLRNGKGAKILRQQLNACDSIEAVRSLVEEYAWEESQVSDDQLVLQ